MDNNYQDMEALNIANRRNKVIENYNKGLEKSITKPKSTYKGRKKQAVEILIILKSNGDLLTKKGIFNTIKLQKEKGRPTRRRNIHRRI